MVADLVKITDSLEKETFEKRLARKREAILQELKAVGCVTVTTAGQTYTLSVGGRKRADPVKEPAKIRV